MKSSAEITSRWWDSEYAEFSQRAADLWQMRITTIDQEMSTDDGILANGSHPETGELIVSLPRVKNVESEFLEEAVADVRSIIPELERMFERREMSAAFVTSLRRFHSAYGFIWSAVCYIRPHIREAQSGRTGGAKKKAISEAKHLVVIAFLSKAQGQGLRMKQAEHWVAFNVAEHARNGGAAEVTPNLLQSLLKDCRDDKYPQLKSTFTAKHIGSARIKAFDQAECARLRGLRELLDRPFKEPVRPSANSPET